MFKICKKEKCPYIWLQTIQNNVQEDLINNLDYNYVGYVSDNRNRITKCFLENIINGGYNKGKKEINTLVIVKNIKGESFKKYLKDSLI